MKLKRGRILTSSVKIILIEILYFLFLLNIISEDSFSILKKVLIKSYNIFYNLYIRRAGGGPFDNKEYIFLKGVVPVKDELKR